MGNNCFPCCKKTKPDINSEIKNNKCCLDWECPSKCVSNCSERWNCCVVIINHPIHNEKDSRPPSPQNINKNLEHTDKQNSENNLTFSDLKSLK